jgi:hypothetical protein
MYVVLNYPQKKVTMPDVDVFITLIISFWLMLWTDDCEERKKNTCIYNNAIYPLILLNNSIR